jgi:serine phosphatase RsbU (regulator of sigma subunit)
VKFKTEKKEQEIQMLTKDQQLKDEKIARRNSVIWVISCGGVVFLVLVILIMRAYRKQRRMFNLVKRQKEEITDKNLMLNQQNEEIIAQRDEIEKQRNQLENTHRQMTDSIHYARRIQRAVLPPEDYVTKTLPEHFILFLPRDIVSGDFYWAFIRENELIVAAVDCTGHGVPGAFMSMLGITFLNEIALRSQVSSAHEILNQLRSSVMKALHQTGKGGEAQDGMDIALCIVSDKNKTLQFSGANSPLWILRNNQINEFPGDRMPIGYFEKAAESFTCVEIQLQTDDIIYIFTDGYFDQFGGSNSRKLGRKGFKHLLIEIQDKSMEEQKILLRNKFIQWKDNNSQLDDVLVIGIKIE